MRFRHCLSAVSLAVALLASAPLLAQPSADPEDGPWAADADGDGGITRDEMRAYMERRFGLMDQDGDGLVPVQVMQRMLGHERQARVTAEGRVGKEGGAGNGRGGLGGSGGGPGGGGGGPDGAGDPPPGDHPRGGDRAGAAPPPPPPGRAMPYPEDSNDDGQIDRAEFLAPALAMFADQDRNGDGVLTAEELPLPPGGEGRPQN
ncbi:hypothetical protein [Sphingobium cupriresistens]|uniref:EF-hand domain-containing protein n=1 Tax=Sphingobium cupriresistens LL01 TaxID=1420583 RepID=A0A0J7XSE0_9SPHN|nr:hypothetical protein [Sphingobium cupriresistens]KMS53963.1 hypothetical protein V473_17295 [Sphingobium cupriresistens LL01]